MKNVRSNQASISVNSLTKLSQTVFPCEHLEAVVQRYSSDKDEALQLY